MIGTVIIQYRKYVDNMFWEFTSISEAADFIRELAEWELQKEYSKEYISRSLLERSDNWVSVLDHLGLRVMTFPVIICNLCRLNINGIEHYYFGCPFLRDDTDND